MLLTDENLLLERLEFMIRAVIFDMDGLMFDTERLTHVATAQAGRELGYPGIADFAREMIGRNEKECSGLYTRYLGGDFSYRGFSARRQEIIGALIRENGVPVKPGLFELLSFLKREGFLLAVATSTSRRHALPYLEQAGAARYFDRMVFGDMLEKSKPAPDIYLKAASELGIPPSDCMALEDSPLGIRSAHDAGMKTVMVPDLLEPDEALKKIVDFCVPSLFEVIELIRSERKESGT
ncbi:HAD family hydrolase [Caproiciproducens sp. NJN-50]|uniref:HAD family hydrolase n=1 Tax=Caproiciproducens sp. NJN-50 TaxID=2507162 RepID=UPI0013E8AAA5|nr:HAD family phosphatase [Caproiciproducens sp. NJN-50]